MGILVIIFSLMLTVPAQATPPRDITMLYDPQKKTLHVEGAHPSDRMQRHFIRRAVVRVKGRDPKEFMFVRQNVPSKFSEDLDIELEKGDVVDVELYCSEGGIGRAHMEMPTEEKEKDNGQTTVP